MQIEQRNMFNESAGNSARYPLMLLRELDDKEIAVRFWNIGGRERFMTLLQRFKGEFLLARPKKLDGLDWLILMETQLSEVNDFCLRYGLQLIKE